MPILVKLSNTVLWVVRGSGAGRRRFVGKDRISPRVGHEHRLSLAVVVAHLHRPARGDFASLCLELVFKVKALVAQMADAYPDSYRLTQERRCLVVAGGFGQDDADCVEIVTLPQAKFAKIDYAGMLHKSKKGYVVQMPLGIDVGVTDGNGNGTPKELRIGQGVSALLFVDDPMQ